MFTTLAKRNTLVKFSPSMLNMLLRLNVCHMVFSCVMLMGRVTLEDNVLMLVMSCLDPSWPSNGPGWCHAPHEQQKYEPTRLPTMFWSYPISLFDIILMIYMRLIENVLCNMYTILCLVWDWVGETNPKVNNSWRWNRWNSGTPWLHEDGVQIFLSNFRRSKYVFRWCSEDLWKGTSLEAAPSTSIKLQDLFDTPLQILDLWLRQLLPMRRFAKPLTPLLGRLQQKLQAWQLVVLSARWLDWNSYIVPEVLGVKGIAIQ